MYLFVVVAHVMSIAPLLSGLGRGRGLFTPASGQPVRPPGVGNTAQPGITRPPPGFGLGKVSS